MDKAPWCDHPKDGNPFMCETCSRAWYGPVNRQMEADRNTPPPVKLRLVK